MNKRQIFFLIIFLFLFLTVGFFIYSQKTLRYNPEKALAAVPDLAKGHYLKAKEYNYNKKYDEAINECKESIKIKPTTEAYCELAISYMEKENFKTAIEYLKKSTELNPRYPKSEYAIAVCYICINPPDTKLAREHYQKAKKLGYQIPDWFERHLKKLEGKK